MNAKRPRFQFRLSTLLFLLLYTSGWLGLNLYPVIKNSAVSINMNSAVVDILLMDFSIYGWPCGVYVQNGPEYDVPPMMGPVTQEDIEKHYGIQKSFRTFFITNLEHGALAWKALGINLCLYGLSAYCLYKWLERKRTTSSPPSS